jgi:hypothetical protein
LKISELTKDQKGHLAWRLDHKTHVGYLTACRIARGELGDLDLIDIFKQAGRTDRSAKIHARKVINFKSGHNYFAAANNPPKTEL